MEVVVVGAGVSGLTTAVALLQEGWDVTVVAGEVSPNLVSDKAGALWEYPPYCTEPAELAGRWALESLEAFACLSRYERETGVRVVDNVTLFRNKRETRPNYHDKLPQFNFGNGEELLRQIGAGSVYRDAWSYKAPVIDTTKYMGFLTKVLRQFGVNLVIRTYDTLAQVHSDFQNAKAIINCCGIFAKDLVGDSSVFPVRGQVVKVLAPDVNFAVADDDSDFPTYVIPRGNGVCVLGGVTSKGHWSEEVDHTLTQEILSRCQSMLPRLQECQVLDVVAGLRPSRDAGIRLAVDNDLSQKFVNRDGSSTVVVHNYGHGGSGICCSWGCSKQVAKLVAANVSRAVEGKVPRRHIPFLESNTYSRL